MNRCFTSNTPKFSDKELIDYLYWNSTDPMVLRLIDIVDKIQTDRDNELAELKSEVDYLTDHNAELLEEINEPKNKKLQKLNDKIRQLRSWNHRQSLEIQDLRERLQVIDIMFG